MNVSWVVILNSNAKGGHTMRRWPYIKEQLSLTGIHFTVKKPSSISDVAIVLNATLKNGNRRFIIIGGDGTLHHWVNAIMNQCICKSNEITNVLIPLGTGNDWFRTLYGRLKIKKLITVIPTNRSQLIDIGKADLNQDSTTYFVNMLSIGYSAHVVHSLMGRKNQSFGKFVYIIAGLKSIFSYQAQPGRICYSGKCQIGDWFALQIGIGKYAGGGLVLAPEADPKDGLLTFLGIPKMAKLHIIRKLWRLYAGNIHRVKNIIHKKVSKIEIEALDDEKFPIESDGEFVGFGSVTVEIVPKAFKILTSP